MILGLHEQSLHVFSMYSECFNDCNDSNHHLFGCPYDYFNIKYTFYLFKHLTFFFDDYYFEYLELFNFQLNQLILIYQYLNFLSSQKSIYNIKFTWQIACDLDDVSLATVACFVLLWLATLIICSKCLLFYADFYVNPCI